MDLWRQPWSTGRKSASIPLRRAEEEILKVCVSIFVFNRERGRVKLKSCVIIYLLLCFLVICWPLAWKLSYH